MVTHTFVDIQLPEAVDYASLSGVRYDLLSTLQLCRFLTSEFENGRPQMEVIEAFSTAILVRYCRAFPPGVRKWPWKDALASLSEPQRKNHERFRHFRSMHVAHSLNAFEENRVQARYCLERIQEEGITSISSSSSTVIGLSSRDLGEISELCECLIKFIEKAIAEEQAKLLPIVRAIPLATLHAQEPPLVRGADFKRVHVRRDKP